MICKVEWCERTHYAKGYCHTHYKQSARGARIVNWDAPERECEKCAIVKPVAEFKTRTARQCMDCKRAYHREWNNTQIGQRHSKQRMLYRYGITLDEYEAKLVAQGGVCAICGGTNTGGRMLAVDHNHTTGQVRDLLCTHCNSAIGQLKEDVELMTKAIEYVKRWEAIAG